MNDPDRQYALLLQRQFESESELGNDLRLAAELQDEFNQEFNIEHDSTLVYKQKKKTPDDSRSLIDPSWELVDPTPNVHNLFVVFNERFFWNKLLTVCVSWSKRMTSCAGICSYQGRGGLCSITLSEPLLKLRPRKDLVETLLHEMIHAFLFVTHNNRDRDGHGPEFHKHMYRINNDAGTNISVYHDFHDEVRLYKQHWWRCNGPCQNRKPFFGMVRRAMNRAPGPNDRWFAEHQQTCGGTFIKVKEPEKAKPQPKVKALPVKKSSDGDIRMYIKSPTKSTTTITNLVRSPKKSIQSPNRDIQEFVTVSLKKPKPSCSNIVTMNSTGESPDIGTVFSKGNIHGFKNLGNASNTKKNLFNTNVKSNGKSGAGMGAKVKSNNSNTVVVTGKASTTSNSNSTKPQTTESFTGNGRTLSSSSSGNTDYAQVRNHWLNKFDNSTNKRPAPQEDCDSTKRPRVSNTVVILDETDTNKYVTCPVCDKKMEESLLNKHIDICLNNNHTNLSEVCHVCNKSIPRSEYSDHVSVCFDVNFDDAAFNDLVECPVCNVNFNRRKIEDHTKSCIEEAFREVQEPSINSQPTVIDSPRNSPQLTQCSVCSDFVDEKDINKHTEQCLHKMMDDIEDKYNLKSINEEVSCLVCKKKIVKSELNAHLDECMSDVFDINDNEKVSSKSDDNKPSCSQECQDGTKYNCPFCMQMYSELNMSGHLDLCLQGNGDDEDKTILIDSFSSEDF